MSFTNPPITLEFAPRCNGHANGRNAETFATDFASGRSWVQPEHSLRFYKDGAVALHTTGYRDPDTRHRLRQYDVDIQVFSDLVGKLYLPDGREITRNMVQSDKRTVLIEGDRLYQLSWRGGQLEGGLKFLPKFYDHDYPFVVWTSRDAMPASSRAFVVHVPSPQKYTEWKAKHGDAVKVARVCGAMNTGAFIAARVGSMLKKITAGDPLNPGEERAMYLLTPKQIDNAIKALCFDAVIAEYLVLK